MATKPPNINVRGIRASMPQGYLLGRLDAGFGPAQLISLRQLQTFIQSIANSDVLPADVQFSTNQVVLGRNTAGAGAGEEVTATQILDWLGAARGDILFRNATVWTVLAPTTDGFLLTTHGAGADPTWTAPGTAVNLTIKDEGATLTATPTSIDFVGAGVVATVVGTAVTVTIAGGGGSSAGMLPLVSGDLPGPSLIADGVGQCIGVPL